MARKKKAPSGPNNGYLVSFGDTMTALLAFFIVLNSLASEQTGANLCSGTGSFVQVTDSHGLPGIFPSGLSKNSLQMKAASPIYPVHNEETDEKGQGPDDEADTIWVRDRNVDEYDRFLTELERYHACRPESAVKAEVALDRMRSLPYEGPLLDAALRRQVLDLLPALASGNYELEIVVWATTPTGTAWKRAVEQASQVRTEIIQMLRLPEERQAIVTASAHTWISSTLKRPSLSLVVRQLDGR